MSEPARLVAACRCGKVVSSTCPTLGDMPAAMDAVANSSWGWHDGVGHACSAACADAAREAAAVRQGRAQRALFDERSAA